MTALQSRKCFLPPCLMLGVCLLLAGLVAGPAACTSILPGQDAAIVTAQRSIAASFDVVDTFIKFDDAHRDQLKQSAPAVHDTAERLRRDAPAAFRQADAAVKTYKAAKTGANKSALDSALDIIEALARQARAALTDAESKGVGGT